MQKISGAVMKLSQILDRIAGYCMFAIMVIVVANVILRALLNRPIVGTIDYVMILSAVMVALALAKCAAENGHVAVDYFMERAPLKFQMVVDAVMSVIAILFWGLCAWQIGVFAHTRMVIGEETMTSRIPLYPFIYLVSLGILALSLVLLVRTMGIFRKEADE